MNHVAEMGGENQSEETVYPNYQPIASTLYMNEAQKEINVNNMCTPFLKLQL